MKSKIKILFLAFSLFFFGACEVLDTGVVDNPNALTPSQASINNLLNNIQINTAGMFNTAQDFGAEVTRMLQMGGGSIYRSAYSPENFDNLWSTSYATVLADIEAVLPLAQELEASNHQGVAKLIKSYIYTTLVDYFADVPFTEAVQGSGNLNPGNTSGTEIYNQALTLLDEAIAHFDEASTITSPDLFFGGSGIAANRAKWIKVANTLKFRIYLQRRAIDPTAGDNIRSLVTGGGLISTAAEDFNFQYSTTLANPNSRHPRYNGNYVNGAGEYMSNHYMGLFENGPAGRDPRRRYYFLRQGNANSSAATSQTLPCTTFDRPAHYGDDDTFCRVGNGYWGRDHGDDDGIPPDGLQRTIWGLYPAGGQFDTRADNSSSSTRIVVTQSSGATGQGIQPIMLSCYVNFLRAEADLIYDTDDDARAQLEAGVRGSIAKVMSFGSLDPTVAANPSLVPTAGDIDGYVAAILTLYDNAANDEERLEVVINEYYKAAFGNGIEAYNAYRRTGYPSNLQPSLEPSPGQFILSFFYPANFVNRNSSAPAQKDPNNWPKVFWQPDNVVPNLK